MIRRLSLQYHPDKNPSKEAVKIFEEIGAGACRRAYRYSKDGTLLCKCTGGAAGNVVPSLLARHALPLTRSPVILPVFRVTGCNSLRSPLR